MEIVEKLDVESGALTASEALAKVEQEIKTLEMSDVKVLKIIHGYGSKGRGGEIKKQLKTLLYTLKKFKKIEDFVPSEKFGCTNKTYQKYSKIYPNLILDKDLKNLNPGITIVFLK